MNSEDEANIQKSSWSSKYRKISDATSINVGQNIIIDGDDTNITKNLPVFIVGSKSAGKSVLISTILNGCASNDVYNKYIYISADGADSTLAETNDTELIMVDYMNAPSFIAQYLKMKAEFISWCKFLIKNNIEFENTPPEHIPHIEILLTRYSDPIVSNYVRSELNIKLDANNMVIRQRKKQGAGSVVADNVQPNIKLVQHAWEIVNKCLKDIKIKVGETVYYLKPLRYDGFDMIIIDDVAKCKRLLFPGNISDNSPLYKYMTVSRHILMGLIIAGQDTQQLPLYARTQIQTFIFGKGINIEKSINDSQTIPANKKREIIDGYDQLEQYQFIGYNAVNDSVFTIAD